MNYFFKSVMLFFSLIFLSATTIFAENISHSVVFQIVQNQMIFDGSTVKSAKIEAGAVTPPQTTPDYYCVDLVLRKSAEEQFSDMTQKGIGKMANITVNGKIISYAKIESEIGGSMQIIVGTKKEAQEFIDSLRLNVT